MTLESILYELEVLIYYGGLMLRSSNKYEVTRADLEGWDVEDLLAFAGKTKKDMLDYISDQDLAEDVLKDNWSEIVEKVLDGMDKRQILDHIRDNYDPDDFIEMDWRW